MLAKPLALLKIDGKSIVEKALKVAQIIVHYIAL